VFIFVSFIRRGGATGDPLPSTSSVPDPDMVCIYLDRLLASLFTVQ